MSRPYYTTCRFQVSVGANCYDAAVLTDNAQQTQISVGLNCIMMLLSSQAMPDGLKFAAQ